jgi:hypothetical protein
VKTSASDGEPVEGEEDREGNEELQDQERDGATEADRAARQRPGARALDARIDVTVHDVVEGAARPAHHQRADGEG